ncbi:MAG: energy transducer TonB [Syntrophobacteraceae bacterium]
MTVADAEVDILFPADPLDMEMSGFGIPQVPVFRDGRTWSSLAVVLLLHAALVSFLWVSSKPLAGSPKTIEVRLISMQGGSETAGGALDGHLEATGGEQSSNSATLLTAPAKQESLDSHLINQNKEILPAERESHSKANQRPNKIERSSAYPTKDIQSVQQLDLPQTESLANQSEGSGEGAGTGTGAAGGSSDQGGAGCKNESGGGAGRASGSREGPSLLRKVSPSYPAFAREREKQGTVLLRISIDEHGRPVGIEVIKKAGFGFDEEAVRAVRDCTFVPAKKEGKPIACKVLLPIRFVLEGS